MIDALRGLVAAGGAVVLSGAGISTESGIPDYRGPTGTKRIGRPVTYEAFVSDAAARQRYWARAFVGFKQIGCAQPNAGHLAVAELQRQGLVSAVITQNVDGLHHAAGSPDVIELHGALRRIVCLSCGATEARSDLDARLHEANPDYAATVSAYNPDGDVEIPAEDVARFVMVQCASCDSGPLKPDVVYFGESVPRERVERCMALVEGASSLLVLGSSLTVFSGFRFVRRAWTAGIPIAIVNDGPTRADDLAAIRIREQLGTVLPALIQPLADGSFTSSSIRR